MPEAYLDHPEVAVYVNIGTVPEWDADVVRQVDLVLDVIGLRDGSVRVEDRDEFDEHRGLLGYPLAMVELAEAATARAVAMLEADPNAFRAGPWLAIMQSAVGGEFSGG